MQTVCKFDQSRIVPISFNLNDDFKRVDNYNSLFLCFLEKGSVSFKINNNVITAIAPCLICINEAKDVEYIYSHKIRAKSISFSPDFINVHMNFKNIRDDNFKDIANKYKFPDLQAFLNNSYYYYGILPVDFVFVENINRLIEICIKELIVQSDEQWSCRVRSYLLDLLNILDSIYLEYSKPEDEDFIIVNKRSTINMKALITYIHLHYYKNINVEELCIVAQTNRTTLNMNFRNYTGKTIHQYINNVRVGVAENMLRFTKLNIFEIAKHCGYQYSSHFINEFKKIHIQTPEEYRKMMLNQRIELI